MALNWGGKWAVDRATLCKSRALCHAQMVFDRIRGSTGAGKRLRGTWKVEVVGLDLPEFGYFYSVSRCDLSRGELLICTLSRKLRVARIALMHIVQNILS